MIYLIFPLEFIQTALFSAFLSLFCWDDQSVTAGKKCQHCPAGQGNLNALVLSDIQIHGVAFLYQHAWQKSHFPYLLPLCYLCYPATPSSGGSGLSMSVGTENNHPSFFGESWHGAAAASLEKPQGHFQAVVLLALSTHIFRSIAFSAVRVKYFPTFALSSFQMPEMETGIARKQQHSQLLWYLSI